MNRTKNSAFLYALYTERNGPVARLNFDTLHDAARYLHDRGMPVSDIARELHQSKRFDALASSTGQELQAALVGPDIARLYESGLSIRDLAVKSGFSSSKVRKLLLGHGVRLRGRGGYRPRVTPYLSVTEPTTYDSLADVIVELHKARLRISQITAITGAGRTTTSPAASVRPVSRSGARRAWTLTR